LLITRMIWWINRKGLASLIPLGLGNHYPSIFLLLQDGLFFFRRVFYQNFGLICFVLVSKL
jgi:hypothetical protein